MMEEFFAVPKSYNQYPEFLNIAVTPITGALGAEITEIDLTDLPAAQMADIQRALDTFHVAVIRDQQLDMAAYKDFALKLGTIGEDPYLTGSAEDEDIKKVIKKADEKTPAVFGGAWHTDWTFLEKPPAYTMLYGLTVPPYGGDTMFSNTHLAYDWLSDGLQSVCEQLTAIHSAEKAYGKAATHNGLFENMDVLFGEDASHTITKHPLVTVHPNTNRKSLFFNGPYIVGLDGWKTNEAMNFLSYLNKIMIVEPFTCRVRWQPGTLVIWDNRSVLHFPVSDYLGFDREMWRITIAGDRPVPTEAYRTHHNITKTPSRIPA